jgi:hypothetical protein
LAGGAAPHRLDKFGSVSSALLLLWFRVRTTAQAEMKRQPALVVFVFVFVFVLSLSLFLGARACGGKGDGERRRAERLQSSFAAGQDFGAGGAHAGPSPTWECEVCEELVKEVVPILNLNRSMSETQFHREMDDLCVRFFPDDGWLIGFCQYIISSSSLFPLFSFIVFNYLFVFNYFNYFNFKNVTSLALTLVARGPGRAGVLRDHRQEAAAPAGVHHPGLLQPAAI